jgi:cytochrome c oxidase subunit 2
MHDIAWYITLVLIGLLAVIFITFIRSGKSEQAYGEVTKRDYAYRGKLFWLAIIAGTVITGMTLMPWPHSSQAGDASPRVVKVEAYQWYWKLSDTEFRVGEPLQFDITSQDVNHGFGIYDTNMTMLAQIQAMPGYTNKLHYTFDQPGEYKILCMEFCGVAHHDMIATINVLPAE